MSGHGFRAMARTILDEVLHVRPEFLLNINLLHAVRDPKRRAYNRNFASCRKKEDDANLGWLSGWIEVGARYCVRIKESP
jgi:hypothetical protein